ncbi:hypothetical protein NEMBOFW57_001635 [Staphylotrichum longicolle]|uniref:Autophagy-related protein 29 n=1 Tax=Staphylotrichum longicolle TaxID=669026 RepID=A0AAD4I1V1_9PEZI|nr:hypothetical protein NEMBOFW57_001635 [Staphylotrichum longicolle]
MASRQRTENPATDRRKRPEQVPEERREPRYHVYIRLPFNRGDFIDPGTVNWDEKKSDALWAVLSDSSLGNVNWTKLAVEFDVTVDFLLQMANYLTERHTSQLRAHMLKAAAARGSNAPSPVPGAEPPGAYQTAVDTTRRITSGTGRAPSALSVRKDTGTPHLRNDDEHTVAGTAGPATKTAFPIRPGSTRNSSSNTTLPSPSQQNQPNSRQGAATRLNDPQRRRISHLSTPSAQQQQYQPQEEDDTEIPPSPAASTSSSSSSSSDSPVESRIIRRPPRFQSKDPRTGGGNNGADPFGNDDDADDDDDAEPAFLPFQHKSGSAQGPGGSSSNQDMGATLRGNFHMRDLAAAQRRAGDASQSQTSDSSVGSAAVIPRRTATTAAGAAGASERRGLAGSQGPLSPRRTAELARRGQADAAGKGKGASREGSDGTPSMGSSFSDLDDAFVTQSALEEALGSRIQDGTVGSRMSVLGSTIGQAIRSRYVPKPNRQ